MLNVVIFSKDRACQLELLLRSSKIFFRGWEQCQPVILYTYSHSSYAEGYDRLKLLHPEFRYVCEQNTSASFKEQVLSLVNEENSYTVFFVDDNIFRQPFSVDDREFKLFAETPSILCLSLRLCPRINYTYSTNQIASPPTFKAPGIWNWQDMPSDTDWSYPMSLDGHIFRTSQIRPLIEAAEFSSPNFLEQALAESPILLPEMSCYADSRVVNVPANRVQDAFPNHHGNLVTAEYLNQAFLSEQLLSLSPILAVANTSVHQEYALELRSFANQHLPPQLSVVVICHNHASILPQFVEKLLMQSLQAFEVILVDQGSTDGTEEVIDRLMQLYPRFQFQLIKPDTFDPIQAQQQGLNRAQGEFKLCISPDQPIFSTLLAEYLKLAQEKDQPSLPEGTLASKFVSFDQFCVAQADFEATQAQLQLQSSQKRQSLERSAATQKELRLANQELQAFIAEKENYIQALLERQEYVDSQLQARQLQLTETQAQLNDTTNLLNQSQAQLNDITNQLNQSQAQLSDTTNQLNQSQAQVNDTNNQLNQTQSQLNHTASQLEVEQQKAHRLQASLSQTEAQIVAMESSKFWQVRSKWIRLKHSLGLVKEDLALRPSPTPSFPEFSLVPDSVSPLPEVIPQVPQTIVQERWPAEYPLVSVIIPCFNYGEYLEEAIDSVLAQTFQDFEIIVVDDGSDQPETLQVLDSLNKPKTTLVRQSNKKLPAARNAGIQLAHGKYICCLDADDLLRPTYLEKCLARLESENLDLCYSWIEEFGDGSEIHRMGEFNIEHLIHHNCAPVSSLFKRQIWERVGGYDESMIHGYEDWNFWLAIAKVGGLGNKVDEPLFLYRKHGRTMVDAALEQHEALCKQIQENHKELFTNPQSVQQIKNQQQSYFVEQSFINLSQSCRLDSTFQQRNRRVLFALPWLVTGGAETVTFQLGQTLRNNEFSLTVCTTEHPPSGAGDQTSKFERITSEIYHLYRFLDKEKWKEFIFHLIESKEINIIFLAGSTYFYDLLPEIKQSFPTLQVIDQLYNEYGHIGNNRKYARYIDFHVVENEAVATCLLEKHEEQEAKVCLIHNGVDTEYFSPEFQPSPSPVDLLLPKNKFIITFMGRFSSEKGPDLFLSIAEQLRNNTEIHFLMAGDGPLHEQIVDLVAQHQLSDRIILPGFMDARECLHVSNLLVVPSRIDGRPNSILESLAMGIPVIAAAVGGIPEIIQNGYTGYICEPENVQNFVDCIQQVVDDRNSYIKMRENSREYALSKLNVAKSQGKYVKVFEQLLEQ